MDPLSFYSDPPEQQEPKIKNRLKIPVPGEMQKLQTTERPPEPKEEPIKVTPTPMQAPVQTKPVIKPQVNVAQTPIIPTGELPLEKLPIKNKANVIRDFSKKYDYILEGDKMYYQVKGGKTWANMSANTVARRNLLTHIDKNDLWASYNNGERQMFEKGNFAAVPAPPKATPATPVQVVKNTTPVPNQVRSKSSVDTPSFKVPDLVQTINPATANTIQGVKNPSKIVTEPVVPEPLVDLPNLPNRLISLYKNWKDRNKAFEGSEVEQKTVSKAAAVKGRESYTGDTISYSPGDKRRYYLPQMLDLGENTFGIRNRGDHKQVDNTPGIVITNFTPFVHTSKVALKDDNSVIAIDNDGKVTAGLFKDFRGKDVKVSKTFSNDVEEFLVDEAGHLKVKIPPKKQNSRFRVPLIKTTDDKIGSVNIFVDQRDENTFGSITGGRFIFTSPDGKRQALISGSAADVAEKFKTFKGEDPFVRIFSLDNGTYSRGLMARDRKLTEKDLVDYDNQNSTGGTGLYLKKQILDEKAIEGEDKYRTIVNQTPNIRTTSDSSYLKGHPLENAATVVVLHHTAYENAQMNDKAVRDQFMKPGGVSAHVVIEENGMRQLFAKPEQVTFHAGVSKWKGVDNVNDFGIGIEFQGNTLKTPLTQAQVESAAEYIIPLILSKRIKLEDIISHAMIAQDRKPDIEASQLKRVKEFVIDRIANDPKLREEYYAIHYQGKKE